MVFYLNRTDIPLCGLKRPLISQTTFNLVSGGKPKSSFIFYIQMIRNYLHISREMPFNKCWRHQEMDAKGIRPITVQFEKHTVSFM